MVLPALWVGVNTAQRQVLDAREAVLTRLERRLELTGERMDLFHRRVMVHLEVLVEAPNLEDFHRYEELGLTEEASVHRARLQDLAATLHEVTPGLAGIGVIRPDGRFLAWSGAKPSSALANTGSSSLASPGKANLSLASRDAWGELDAWAVAILDRDALMSQLEPGVGLKLTLLPPGSPSPSLADSLVRVRECADWTLVLRADGRSIEAAGATARRQALATAAFSVLAAIFLAAWLARRIAARIRRLADQAAAIGDGRVGSIAPDALEDEIGYLSQTLNTMGHRIQTTQQTLAARVDELEHTKDQLVHAEKLSALGTLTAGVAHEVHSPIQAIQVSAGTLRMLRPEAPEAANDLREIADEITEAVGHVLEVTSALRDYARAPDQEFHPEPTDVRDVVDRALRLLRAQRGVDRVAVSGDARPALASAQRLTQAILNLVRNALDADRDGQVLIEVADTRFSAADIEAARACQGPEGSRDAGPRPDQPAVAIRIRDQGPGMTADLMRRAFDPFFSTKPATEGTGLGLSVTQGIVWQHGGLLVLRSSPGEGLTATVLVPATSDLDQKCDTP